MNCGRRPEIPGSEAKGANFYVLIGNYWEKIPYEFLTLHLMNRDTDSFVLDYLFWDVCIARSLRRYSVSLWGRIKILIILIKIISSFRDKA